MIPTNHQEIWKDIKGYEGKYQVSSFGRVKSVTRTITKINKYGKLCDFRWPEKILSQSVWGNGGYFSIAFGGSKSINRSSHLVHRLVAQAFIENPLNLPEVNHIDADRKNNNVANLEWCDRAGNTLHAYNLGNKHRGSGHQFASLPRDSRGRCTCAK